MKFKQGDRVRAKIAGKYVTGEVVKYSEQKFHGSMHVECRWDDDGNTAHISESALELDPVYKSPLYKAME